MALQIGDRVGDYEVLALIGAGGMGRVYKVRNIISNREEAMKILLPDLTSERDLAVRFMMEIRTLATLEHPNIAQLRTAFQFDNQLVMIMEFVEGVTLEKLATEAAIPVDRVLDYATQVLSALAFAHAHGVIHRDIKPANVMITSHGQVKLMDFGIAKNADEMHLTRPGMTIGSVYYMSPEQVRGGTVDARSDLYSFGITLYELLTGRKPFQADTSYSVLNAQCNEAPIPPIEVNPALSPELNAVVLRALEKSPDARYQTAEEFHDALKALRVGASASPAPAAAAGFAPVAVAGLPGAAEAFSATSAGFAPVPGTGTPAPGAGPAQQAAPAAAPFVPVANAKPVAAAAGKSHRGLWIGLGALAAVLALVAIAVVLPHVYAILAKQKAGGAAQDATVASTSTPAPSQQPATPTPDATAAASPSQTVAQSPAAATSGQAGNSASPTQGGGGSPHRPPYAGAGTQASSGTAAGGGGAASSGSVAPSIPAGPSLQEVREAKDRLMNIEARADAARSGVESIRRQQQAQGMDIRGDILAAINRLNSDLRQAQGAVSQNDLQAAGEYMQQADRETTTLEKFLGR